MYLLAVTSQIFIDLIALNCYIISFDLLPTKNSPSISDLRLCVELGVRSEFLVSRGSYLFSAANIHVCVYVL